MGHVRPEALDRTLVLNCLNAVIAESDLYFVPWYGWGIVHTYATAQQQLDDELLDAALQFAQIRLGALIPPRHVSVV